MVVHKHGVTVWPVLQPAVNLRCANSFIKIAHIQFNGIFPPYFTKYEHF